MMRGTAGAVEPACGLAAVKIRSQATARVIKYAES